MSSSLGDKHIKALPKAKLAHHIVRKVTEPIPHIPDNPLPLVTLSMSILFIILVKPGQHRTKLPHMQQHHILHPLQRTLRERLAEHTSLASMHRLVNCIVRVVHPLDGWEGVIEIRFLEPFPVPVDVVQSLVCVDRYKIRRDPYMCPVLSVEIVEPEVAVAFETVPELHPWRDGCDEWTWNAAEGVDEAVVEGVCDCLSIQS